jgi:CRP-like cAMP-binding protein
MQSPQAGQKPGNVQFPLQIPQRKRNMSAPKNNLLLEALSPESREAILSEAKEVSLAARHSLQAQEEEPLYVYFLTSGIASIVVAHFEGASSETLLIGHEGFTSGLSLLGSSAPTAECMMQVSGTGFQVPLPALRELFQKSSEIRTRLLQCIQQQAMTTIQIAGCNATHEAEPRLARWLLMVQDRTQEDTFQLTQEFVAQMLGARRTTVALAAGALQRSGLIEYSRGRVTILSREALQAAACDCYQVTRRLITNLYV